jgi:hypothetical protein
MVKNAPFIVSSPVKSAIAARMIGAERGEPHTCRQLDARPTTFPVFASMTVELALRLLCEDSLRLGVVDGVFCPVAFTVERGLSDLQPDFLARCHQ